MRESTLSADDSDAFSNTIRGLSVFFSHTFYGKFANFVIVGFYGLTKTDSLYLETVRSISVKAFYHCSDMVGLTWRIKTLMTRKTAAKWKMREAE
jgi:hypothetical protein